jgi:hypothetical protein
VLKLALPRRGDCAPLALIELTRKPGEETPLQETKRMLARAAETLAHTVPAPKALEAVAVPPAQPESATPASEALIEVEASVPEAPAEVEVSAPEAPAEAEVSALEAPVEDEVSPPEESEALETGESSETGDAPVEGTSEKH